MSDKKHEDAELLGFTGPVFHGLDGIQRLYRGLPSNLNAQFLTRVLNKLPNHDATVVSGVETSDRYKWAHAIYFNYEGHRIVLLLPCTLHISEDGSSSDRHVAWYYQGPAASQRVVTNISMKLFSEFTKAYFIEYGIIM